MGEHKEEIKKAYKDLGRAGSLYDQIITYSTPLGGWMNKMIWGFTKEENDQWLENVLDAVPADFASKLLEVPVGTGILTMPLYRTIPKAQVTCLDYSEQMMNNAKKRAEEMNLQNITFRQGDVGALPFEDETFDLVLSLNGFHAFPDKEAAYRETYRVLKKGGIFCGCFYIREANPKTDKWIHNVHERKGFFTPPYETVSSLTKRLSDMYEEAAVTNVKSIATFRCVK